MNTERITTKEEEDMEKLLPPKSHRLVIPCDVKLKIKDSPFVLITSDLRNVLVDSF